MNELEKEYDRCGLKLILNGEWGHCQLIKKEIEEANENNTAHNIFYDVSNLNYEFGDDIICLVAIPRKIYGKLIPVTIYAPDKPVHDAKTKAVYGWKGIAKFFAGYEQASGKKILFFNYEEALESFNSAYELLNKK